MNILIADDSPVALMMLQRALEQDGHTVRTATNGQEALEALSDGVCRLVISDWEMPEMTGLELCHCIRSAGLPGYVYFILLTSRGDHEDKLAGLNAGADDFISKPFDQTELLVKLRGAQRLLALESRELTIFAMAKLAESRDLETGAHLERVRVYTRLLALEICGRPGFEEVTGEYVRTIYLTSPLHDIGKVAIPDAVLQKPGRFTDEEFAIMKTHTIHGAATLHAALDEHPGAAFLQMAYEIALTHHERWDGSGYPHGLKGREIPLCGRIMAIADVYDALTSKRVYKPPFAHEQACAMIRDSSGSHFDPELVAAFVQLQDQFAKAREAHNELEHGAACPPRLLASSPPSRRLAPGVS